MLVLPIFSRTDSAMQGGNQIGDEGGQAIAAAFQVNSTVKKLNLVSYRMQS